jgi:SAM-dependent methyltransferase
VDANPDYVTHVRSHVSAIRPDYPLERIKEERVESLSYESGIFDLVISMAVLHFAPDTGSFNAMMEEMWRVLKPGGLLFIRCASDIGMQGGTPLGNGRWHLPDNSERYLLTQSQIDHFSKKWPARQVEPLKTTNVQNYRWMTTWVLLKENK